MGEHPAAWNHSSTHLLKFYRLQFCRETAGESVTSPVCLLNRKLLRNFLLIRFFTLEAEFYLVL